MPRILTPATHSEETLAIAHDLLSPGWDLVSAPHGRPEFLELLKDTDIERYRALVGKLGIRR